MKQRTMLPAMSVVLTQEEYPYMLFVASSTAGAIKVTGNACANGEIVINGTASFNGSASSLNGKVCRGER